MGAVDDVGEAALEDAECFDGLPVRLSQSDATQRRVELPIAGAREPVTSAIG